MAYVNIAALVTINGVTSATQSITNTGMIVLSAPPTNHTYKINTVMAANKSATASNVTLSFVRNSTTFYIMANQVTVPANASLVIIGKDNPFYLYDVTSDTLSATATTLSAIDMFVSFEDIF